MKIYVPKETDSKDARIAMVPVVTKKIIELGAEVYIEKGLGKHLNIRDDDFIAAGASILTAKNGQLDDMDLLLRVTASQDGNLLKLKPNVIHISFLNPYLHQQLIATMCRQQVTALSMELIPRITRAQPMDALTSQANLAGYFSAIVAAEKLNKVFPMMTTAAGTIIPAKVFVIGVGVAGLQAIATAKRLGARVYAYDTRPIVEEQVKSLGAVFVKADIGATEETEQGYAKALTPEQLALQQKAMEKACGNVDVVITTAQVFGRQAPVILTRDIIKQMQPGSIIIDLAIDSGGNVEGLNEEGTFTVHGVKVISIKNISHRVALDASMLYANNLFYLIKEGWDSNEKTFKLDLTNEIIKSIVVSHQGESSFMTQEGESL